MKASRWCIRWARLRSSWVAITFSCRACLQARGETALEEAVWAGRGEAAQEGGPAWAAKFACVLQIVQVCARISPEVDWEPFDTSKLFFLDIGDTFSSFMLL